MCAGTSGFCVEILTNKDEKDFVDVFNKICHGIKGGSKNSELI
jgi:hypothetical protein